MTTTLIETPVSRSALRDHAGEIEHDLGYEPEVEREKPAFGLYRELFERSADAILVIENETFVDCNQATVDMLRYASREELLQTHPSQLSPEYQPDGRLSFEKANEMMSIAMKQGSHRFEWDHLRADGEVFPVEVLLTTIPKGDDLLIHTVWRDITERKRLQNELHQAHKLEAIGKLAGGIAHDFNNLLVAILGNAELLMMDLGDDGPHAQCVTEIQRAGNRAAGLVGQLLAYSRKQVLRTTVLNLNDVVIGLSPMLRHLIGEDIATTACLSVRPLAIRADVGQIEQVVMNLATNARDAMPEGGVLCMETDEVVLRKDITGDMPPLEPGRYARLRVRDAGCGIEPKHLGRIFDPFFTTKPHGTGLGLSTVIGIVRQSGGDITVASDLGDGTTFSIYLPVTDEPITPVEQADTTPVSPAKSGEAVLLVEDEASVALLVERILRDEGYQVHRARDGRDALAKIEDQDLRFDLLLTDVIMPHMGGPELARRLEASLPDLKVLYVSGYTNETLTHRGVLDEGVELIAKPYTTDQLKRKVRAILDDE